MAGASNSSTDSTTICIADKPVFVFGQPRSRSTLLMRLLNRAQDADTGAPMFCKGECKFIHETAYRLRREAERRHSSETLEAMERAGKFPAWFSLVDPNRFDEGLAALVRSWVNPPQGSRWGTKEVCFGERESPDGFVRRLNTWRTIFPELRVILLWRDYSEILASQQRTGWWRNDPHGPRRIQNQERNFKQIAENNDWISLIHSPEILNLCILNERLAPVGLKIDSRRHREVCELKLTQ